MLVFPDTVIGCKIKNPNQKPQVIVTVSIGVASANDTVELNAQSLADRANETSTLQNTVVKTKSRPHQKI